VDGKQPIAKIVGSEGNTASLFIDFGCAQANRGYGIGVFGEMSSTDESPRQEDSHGGRS
jgi:hypothetical protein